ncbi:beta family protein [Clostridium butyricum]
MYIPMMKTRQEEFRVAHELNCCYSEKIIPLFEIIDEIYEDKFETDESGNYITILKEGNTRKSKVKKPRNVNDIITLNKINKTVNGNRVFIDYFRFDIKKYGNNLSLKDLELAYKLNNSNNEYIKKLKLASKEYKNMIPVFSIKKPFNFLNTEIVQIITELQNLNESIALRIEDEFFYLCKQVIENNLRESDFFLYDISEQDFYSKIMDIQDISICKTKAKKVLINSPRKLKLANKDYEDKQTTVLINNCVAHEYSKYGFYGFGDYGGLKDQLPTNAGSNGSGAALGLIYNYENNEFYSFCNSDTSLGQTGYKTVIKDVLSYKSILDKDNKCYAYKKLKEWNNNGKNGGWKSWNNVCLTRYIHQMYRNL